MSTAALGPPSPSGDRMLRDVLAGMVADGTLAPEQADAVLASVAARSTGRRPAAQAVPGRHEASPQTHRPGPSGPPAGGADPARRPGPPRWLTRLAEAGAYLGGALVLTAGALVVAHEWGSLERASKVAVLAGVALAFAVAGTMIVVVAPDRLHGLQGPEGAVLRRLASTLLAGSAVAAAGACAAAVAAVSGSGAGGRALLLAAVGLPLVTVSCYARVTAPSALAELVLYAGLLVLVAAALVAADATTTVPVLLGLLTASLAWVAVATVTRWLSAPRYARVVGLVSALAVLALAVMLATRR